MTSEEYRDLCQRTSKVVDQGVVDRANALSKELREFEILVTTLSRLANSLKRKIFYAPDSISGPVGASDTVGKCVISAYKTLHAILGIASELDEVLQGTNYFEEIGDIDWYLSELASAEELNREDIQKGNIAKLYERYPKKFSSENAYIRNLKKELNSLAKYQTPKTDL